MASNAQEAVTQRIPHRPPFLFVDSIVEESGPDGSPPRLVAEWTVPADSAFFVGHYPGNPILPGVILSEFVFQTGALLVGGLAGTTGTAETPDSGVPVLVRVTDARFRRRCGPGDVLRAEVSLTDQLGPAYHLKGRVTAADGRTALTLHCVVAMVAEEGEA